MSNLYDEIYSNDDEKVLTETMKVLTEANVVKMDKATLKKRLLTRCALLAAKEDNSPLYDQYVKATKIRKKKRKLIQKQYASAAKVKLRQYLANQKKKK